MMTNVGVLDRALRVVLGLALLGWSVGHYGPPLPWLLSWVIAIAGAYPLITGLLRFCPVFRAMNMSTCAEEG
jgi:hypothetical protein